MAEDKEIKLSDIIEGDECEEPGKKPKQMPWIMVGMCEGCTDCSEACPQKGIKLVNMEKKMPNAWLVEFRACTGCGKCAKACIWGAIQMTSYVDWALERYEKYEGGPYPSKFDED
jgi:formate hydrogenlyase subunit 6/NADH:ubiquinone oxidoreductase subunit I